MKYPVTLSEDLKQLTAFYKWNAADKIDVRDAFTDCPPMVQYFTVLAAAHRAGYAQDAGNGFMRLQAWCFDHGLPDPYSTDFDVAALDAMPAKERAA